MTTIQILLAQSYTAADMRVIAEQTHASDWFDARRVPLTMSRAQEYFWGAAWQQGERAALADLEAGRRVRFASDDPEDAARGLDAPDGPNAG
jgi:hypothetical protein